MLLYIYLFIIPLLKYSSHAYRMCASSSSLLLLLQKFFSLAPLYTFTLRAMGATTTTPTPTTAATTAQKTKVKFALFDLDGCLYPIENGYEHACRTRAFEFMVSTLGYENIDAAKRAWKREFTKHNQTLKSLRELGHSSSEFKKETYWEFTRGDCSRHLEPDEKVRECLRKMSKSFPKFVLTNCAETEAKQALKRLNVLDQFDFVYGADFMGDTCKPSKESFGKVLRDVKRRMKATKGGVRSGGTDDDVRVDEDDITEEEEEEGIQKPFDDDEVFMFEDSLKNLVSAKDNFNITGVLIKGKTLSEENGSEVSKRFVQIDRPVLSELMEKVPSLFA